MSDFSETAASQMVEALAKAGASTAYCVPGESFLGVLEALQRKSTFRVVTTRHEGGAAFMAEAHAKLTGELGVCLATRMVGAGNLAIGLHTARQDSSPVLAVVGQVRSGQRHREAFQEVDVDRLFAPVVKWAAEPTRADRLPEITYRAARTALSGRPGPVVIAVQEDLCDIPVEPSQFPQIRPPRSAPLVGDVRHALDLIGDAKRPLLLLGEDVIRSGASKAAVAVAEKLSLAVMTTWRRADAFPNDHDLYVGMTGLGAPPAVRAVLDESDFALALGARLDENGTHGYTFPRRDMPWAHVYAEPEAIGGVFGATLSILSDSEQFLEAILRESSEDAPTVDEHRLGWVTEARRRWLGQTEPRINGSRTGYVDQEAAVAALRRHLPTDSIVTSDAGNFSGWSARYLRWSRPGTLLAPNSGAMGYALPAAIAARLAAPDRTIVALAGDGGFLMTGNELETAVREGTPVVAIVFDNQRYGTIAMHQQLQYANSGTASDLGPVDFAMFAESMGARGLTASTDREFEQAVVEGLAHERGPVVIHALVDPEQISVNADTDAQVAASL